MRYATYFIYSICFLLIAQRTTAQQVLVTIGVTPPYSPYLSNYTSTDANKVFLTLQNTTARPIQVRLAGSAVGDNGVSIRPKPGFMASSVITLAGLQVRQLNGTALSEIFDLNNFDVSGIDRNTLARTLRLPEGNYNLCVQALDYNSGQVVSGSAPSGCAMISIAYPEPPVLVSPLPGDSVNAAIPQTLVFTWMNPGSVPIGTEYTLQLQEMPAPNANPNQVLNGASFPLLSQTVKTTSYVYSIRNLALKKGSKYAWRVVAKDPAGRITFKNNGTSAAGVFTYGRAELVESNVRSSGSNNATATIKANKLEVTGSISYQYHLSAQGLPAGFTGIKDQSLPLINEPLQLCYGLCRVKMNLSSQLVEKVVANSSLKNTKMPDGVKVTPVGKDSSKVSFYHTDSIPSFGLPSGWGQAEPAGATGGGLGQVLATATTDSLGNFLFSTVTNKWCSIVETYPDKTALVYCYYINIKNKRFSDPRTYVYIPVDNADEGLAIGNTKVYLDNYNLKVRVNRDQEISTIQTEFKNASVENKADGMADVYILRKTSGAQTTAGNIPASEGDNTGRIVFKSQADKTPSFTMFSSYAIIAKRTVATTETQVYGTGSNNYGATAEFGNLLYNLNNKESYYVYVEYKGSSIYFEPREYNFQPDDIDEYSPTFAPVVTNRSMELKPSYVAIRIKGVMKYQFQGKVPAPLGNVKVSLRSIYWQLSSDPNVKGKAYDYANSHNLNKIYATVTTDASGYFEFNAGNIAYDSYKIGNALLVGADQLITVDNCYYGSPDKVFYFEAGNSYNVGELVAQVKDYTFSPIIRAKNAQSGVVQPLKGQRVFLCRKAGVKPSLWGVPADEGAPKSAPSKTIKDADGAEYNVISYGETDAFGKVVFPNLVAKDFSNSEDMYYLYSESGITSTENYSTRYGMSASIDLATWFTMSNYYMYTGFVLNGTVRKKSYNTGPYFEAFPLAPYVEGGVYPHSNTSTNALPGVIVRLYDIPKGVISATDFEKKLADKDLFTLLAEKKATLQKMQTTGANGVFYFDDLSEGGKYAGWKLLVYSKPGFVTHYTILNSGNAMVAGTKQTVKGFLLPPQLVHVTVKDEETGAPVAANIVVGDQFSWSAQEVITSLVGSGTNVQLKTYTNGANLTTPYGNVSFTVIPDDNVHYRTQTFSRSVKAPVAGSPQPTTPTQTLADFTMLSRRNRVSVCLLDEATKKGLAGTVTFLDIPATVNPAANPVFLLKNQCKGFSFVSAQSSYRVQVTSEGYVTQTITVNNNTNDEVPKDLLVKMKQGITVSGTVTVDGKPVKGAKVYIKELPDLPEVATDNSGNYSLSGLPKNDAKVTIAAVKPDMNAIGQTKTITLGYGSSSSSGSSGNTGSSGSGTTTTIGSGIGNGGTISLNTNALTGTNLAGAASQNLQSQLDAMLNIKQVNFDLKTNSEVDLTTLYGFPLEVEGLVARPSGNMLTGRIRITNNNVFGMAGKQSYLHFTNIKVAYAAASGSNKPGDLGNIKAKAKLSTSSGKVEMDDDEVLLNMFGQYTAVLNAYYKGIQLEAASASEGTVTGTVTVNSDALPGNVQWDGAVSAMPETMAAKFVKGKQIPSSTRKAGTAKAPGAKYNLPVEASVPVFISGSNLQGQLASSYVFRNEETTLSYRLNNLFVSEATEKSYIAKDGLRLYSKLHTKLENISKPDIAVNIGQVKVTNAAMDVVSGKNEIDIPLDNWNIKSTSWYIENGAIQMTGNIVAGAITVPAKGLEISETTIGFGDLKLDKIAVAGVYPLTINQDATLTSFGYDKAAQYGTLYDKKYGCWSLSLLPKNEKDPLTQMTGLADMADGDKLNIMNISLYSKGSESRIILQQNHAPVTLNGFASFKPYEVENGSNFLKVKGALSFSVPGLTGTENAPYSLDYTASGNKLVHVHNPIGGLKLVTNGIRTEFFTTGQVFTGKRLELKGTLKDKVATSPYALQVKFLKTGNETRMDVDTTFANQVSLGGDQVMKKISGSMAINNASQWNNFVFEGDVLAGGMTAQEDKQPGKNTSHMVFEVKGDLVANKAQLGVKNMPLPEFLDGTFNLTYDFDKKAIVGSAQLNKISTPSADFSAAVEMLIGGGEWYVLGSMNVERLKVVPLPLNGAGAAFCIGNSPLSPEKLQVIQPVFHNGVLPGDFASRFSKIRGVLFVAALDLKLPLPGLDIDIGVASVHVGYGIYGNAYVGLNFDEDHPVVDGGLKVGAYVNVNGGATAGIACAGVALGAELNALGTVHMDLPSLKNPMNFLNPKTLLLQSYIKADVVLTAELKGSAYVGAGVCNSNCNSVKVLGVTVPPGCYKKGISKTLTVSGGVALEKMVNMASPSKATIYVNLFDKPYSSTITIPHL